MTSPDAERTSWRTARRERKEAVVALRRRALAATSLAAVLDDALEVVTTLLNMDFSKIVKRGDDRDAVTIVAADELAFLQAVADVIAAAAYRFDLDASARKASRGRSLAARVRRR